ncbi:MAG: pyridoxamine 5-phosphate oxidase-related FMN-binding protein [Segetibacter sp.]|nr:pyridoxamine 5-phosphate oxidase-related FMN-binding protein [Segetibacter sp.]
MLGQLDYAEIEEVLKGQFLGRIGCHDDDLTYIVPVSYVYDGRFVYGCTKNGMKVEIMRKNPKICFEVESLQDMANWRTVIAWGIFEEITNIAERRDALQKLNRRRLPLVSSETTHLSPNWPFEPSDLNTIPGIVYRLALNNKTGRFENMEGAVAISHASL